MQIPILIHDESFSTTLNYIIVSFIIHNRDILLFKRLFYLDTIDLRWSSFGSSDEYFSKIQTINSNLTFHIDFQ